MEWAVELRGRQGAGKKSICRHRSPKVEATGAGGSLIAQSHLTFCAPNLSAVARTSQNTARPITLANGTFKLHFPCPDMCSSGQGTARRLERGRIGVSTWSRSTASCTRRGSSHRPRPRKLPAGPVAKRKRNAGAKQQEHPPLVLVFGHREEPKVKERSPQSV